jgi:hypothetical protein
MWKFLANLLNGSEATVHAEPKLHASTEGTQPRPVPTEAPLNLLWQKVGHLSHPEHRFLHPTYSPSSRVPCADFTPFIAQRLRNHDVASIRQLMRCVIAGNPGLGIGPEWIDKSVDEIAVLDLTRYCEVDSPDFALELKSLFILGAKEGGGREFWLADEKPLLFSLALCCHDIRWLEGVDQLREKANRFIQRMRKDTPFWEDYPLFRPSEIEFPGNATDTASILLELPVLSRIQLLSFVERGAAPLMQATSYKMRNLGINPLETAPSLLASGLCELTADLEAVADVFSKSELVSVMDEKAVPYRKSWKKQQMLEVLATHAPDVIAQVAEREKTARIRTEYLPGLRSLSQFAYAMQENIKLLCFAGPAT